MQTKDIHDGAMLAIVDVWEHIRMTDAFMHNPLRENWLPEEMYEYDFLHNHWVMWADIEDVLGDIPQKVLRAKMHTLIRRGLLDGCNCGCRGDFKLTEKGRAYLATLNGEEPDDMTFIEEAP